MTAEQHFANGSALLRSAVWQQQFGTSVDAWILLIKADMHFACASPWIQPP